MPPFSLSICASVASRNGVLRPIGRMNLPSRTSSANSRTLDGSDFARTGQRCLWRCHFQVGFKSVNKNCIALSIQRLTTSAEILYHSL